MPGFPLADPIPQRLRSRVLLAPVAKSGALWIVSHHHHRRLRRPGHSSKSSRPKSQHRQPYLIHFPAVIFHSLRLDLLGGGVWGLWDLRGEVACLVHMF